MSMVNGCVVAKVIFEDAGYQIRESVWASGFPIPAHITMYVVSNFKMDAGIENQEQIISYTKTDWRELLPFYSDEKRSAKMVKMKKQTLDQAKNFISVYKTI